MSRCPSYVAIVVAAMALASPLASAQLTPAFTLSTADASESVFPGETANFTIVVSNGAPIPRTAAMSVSTQLPVDWTAAFSPPSVAVNASSNATTLLSVFVPADATPQTVNVTIDASDDLGGRSAPLTVAVTVKARPVSAPSGTTGVPSAPKLILTVSQGDAGEAGSTVTGAITILNDDETRSSMNVQLGATGPWGARIPDSGRNRVLGELGSRASVPVLVDVPSSIVENTTVTVTISAIVDGKTFTTPWLVTGIAPPAAPAEGSGTSSTTTASDTGSTGGRTTFPRSNFEILVQPLELPIEPGSDAQANVRITNTGSTPLTVVLTAPPPLSWRPFDLADTVTVEPGASAVVPMTLHAPEGLPSGGTAEISVQGAADGIVRRSPLFIRTVPPSIPVDETPAATQTEAPVAPEGSGLPSIGPVALVAVGLAAAGTGALVLASRPLREKILWGAAGLYTRLARPDVLGHEDREKLYRLVETQPGIHFHALQRDLAWNTGTLTYHIRVLEKHGFVVSRRDGLYRRFYLSGAAPRKEVFENAGPSGLRADVIEAIRNTPGISQSDLALALGANKQTVNYHVKALERTGSIRVEKRGRDTYLYPGTPSAPAGDVARA